jgi:citrate lyase beta subunit
LGCGQTWEVMAPYRSQMIVTCALANIQAVDAPFLNIKDAEGLLQECTRAKSLGFSGKLCIHPSQLDPVNQTFSPDEKEIEWAQKIVAAVALQGSGAILVEGRMVDAPVVRKAQRIVESARLLRNPALPQN